MIRRSAISSGARRYRMQMRWRAWWHEVTIAGSFTAIVGFTIGTLAAVGSSWGSNEAVCAVLVPADRSVAPVLSRFCRLAYQVEFGVAFGIIALVGVVFTVILISLQARESSVPPAACSRWSSRSVLPRYLIASLSCIFAFAMSSLITSALLVEQDKTPGLGPLLVAFGGLAGGLLLVVLLYGVARQQYIGTILERTARQTIGVVDSGLAQARYESEPRAGARLMP